ncbi:bis(5'-nucleosyl)-tetraphosphatase (symmetrical) YqeK [Carnobacteriaceae bacterium zg-ZUI252]|nr:bis(5'-nucleosyl)-tetraphosphatase (symmetrical) YqeK [Carnobacteriaceae bacterium zg-ZUI252]QTU82594.1 bis(5'-nucleosyl)-tetraphosphatase (symmetrical) YqeK [Carnobacteriaceae bacterium zg-C25]
MLTNTLRHKIVSTLQGELSSKRYVHVLRVEEKAITLAKQYGVDVAQCQLAALLHDLTKEWTMEQYKEAVEKYQLDGAMLSYGSEILHGPVAACVCGEWFGVTDDVVCEAIAYHTIGKEDMSDVAKVLFVADYIEDGRTFEGVDEARRLANENLDEAIAYKLQQTLAYLANKGLRIYPDTVLAYNAWVNKIKER